MSRFARTYATLVFIIVITTNFVLILLYGRQFYSALGEQVCQIAGCPDENSITPSQLLLANLVLLTILILMGVIIRMIISGNRHDEKS